MKLIEVRLQENRTMFINPEYVAAVSTAPNVVQSNSSYKSQIQVQTTTYMSILTVEEVVRKLDPSAVLWGDRDITQDTEGEYFPNVTVPSSLAKIGMPDYKITPIKGGNIMPPPVKKKAPVKKPVKKLPKRKYNK